MQILFFRYHTFTINFTSFRTENSRLFVSEVYCSLIRLNSQCLFMQCNIGTVFSHELCTFPPRLFATEELLLAADTKSELAKSFPSLEDPASSNRDDMKYVINRGMLIRVVHKNQKCPNNYRSRLICCSIGQITTSKKILVQLDRETPPSATPLFLAEF